MACHGTKNCQCGRCSALAVTRRCDFAPARLSTPEGAYADSSSSGGGQERECPTVFADYFAQLEGQDTPQKQETAQDPAQTTQQITTPEDGSGGVVVDPCLHVEDPCNLAACKHDPKYQCGRDPKLPPDEDGGADDSPSVQRAGPADAALALLGLALGGQMIHYALTEGP
jgi:hypothetical protein